MELKLSIEAVGLNNVIQTCTINVNAMLGALDELVAMYLHLYKQGCYVHILDFFLKDWRKIRNVQNLNNKGQVSKYLLLKPSCDNGIVLQLFIDIVIESTIRDEVCMQLLHDCLRA